MNETELATVKNDLEHLQREVDRLTVKVENIEKTYTTKSDVDQVWDSIKDNVTYKNVKLLITILSFIMAGVATLVTYIVMSVKGGG